MGATTFFNFGTGKTAQDAFDLLCEEERDRHGRHGYTGTIAEKHAFVLISDDARQIKTRAADQVKANTLELKTLKGSTHDAWAADSIRHRRAVSREARDSIKVSMSCRGKKAGYARDRVAAMALAEALVSMQDRRVDDKWGPAGLIKIKDGSFLFFGWASE